MWDGHCSYTRFIHDGTKAQRGYPVEPRSQADLLDDRISYSSFPTDGFQPQNWSFLCSFYSYDLVFILNNLLLREEQICQIGNKDLSHHCPLSSVLCDLWVILTFPDIILFFFNHSTCMQLPLCDFLISVFITAPEL